MFLGEKNLRVAKTQWFDIIYPERCVESAAILYEKADTVYEEVTGQYGLTPAFRMPIVITPAVDQFNAFWTAIPYNHIAIYDTGVSGENELAVFSETLLSTFRHELTHAVTYNMKNGFWKITGMLFGDCITPGMFSVTTGMAEGATLPSESAAGEGRLNDEYAKHLVKQAKIENNFPSYHDVSGAADVSPGGAPYYFNGAFHQWLQTKYGLQAYAQFWYRVVNGKNFTIAGAFKKAFGVKLKNAWKLFVEEYEVPQVAADPVSEGLVNDFFEPDSKSFSPLNNTGSLFDSLTSCNTKTIDGRVSSRLVWFDHFGGRVYSADLNQKARQLFSMRGINKVHISNDGRLIAVSYTSENSRAPSARVKIYDIDTGHFFTVKESGLKDAAVLAVTDNENERFYYLLAQKYFNQHYSISISKILMNEDQSQIKETEPFSEILLPAENNPYAFTLLKGGNFAFIKKDHMKYSLCVYSVNGQQLREFSFADGITVRSLSAAEGSFVFSYAKKGTLPRLGFMDAETGEIKFSREDISGGVFEPVLYDNTLVYIGKFYRQNRLLCMSDVAEREYDVEEKTYGAEQTAVQNPGLSYTPQNLTLPSTKYSPFPYLLHGLFIPVSSYKTEYFGINADYSSNAGNSYLGFTYVTANPWTDGSSDLYTLTGGWNTLSNSFGLDLQIKKTAATSIFESSAEIKSEFDPMGWKQSGAGVVLSTVYNFGNFSSVLLGNSSQAFIGRQDKKFPEKYADVSSSEYRNFPTISFWDKELCGITAASDSTLYYMLQDVVSLQYSNIHRAGTGRFEYSGFAAGLTFGARYDSALYKKIDYMKAVAIGGNIKVRIPRLLPFESKYGFTYNFPLRLNAVLFPSQSIYGYTQPKSTAGQVVFDATAETTLFSMDLQLAMPGITALYLNDFYFSAGYACTGAAGKVSANGFQNLHLGNYFSSIFSGNGYYLDSFYVKAALELTPNIGMLAKSAYKIGLVTTFSYVIHSPELIKPEERIKLSIGVDANF